MRKGRGRECLQGQRVGRGGSDDWTCGQGDGGSDYWTCEDWDKGSGGVHVCRGPGGGAVGTLLV